MLLLGICFGMVLGLSYWQNSISSNNEINTTSQILSVVISITIAVVNVVLGLVIRYLTFFERDYTSTKHQTSLAIKSIFAQMISTILIPVMVANYIKNNLYSTSGLADNIFIMTLTNTIVEPIVLYINPGYLIKKVMIYFKTKPGIFIII
jgi:hypothetical protein